MTYVICPGSGARVGARFVLRFPAEPKDLHITTCRRCWQNVPAARLATSPLIGAYIVADHAVKETLHPERKAGR